MSSIENESTIDLVKEFTKLEYEIECKILRYDNIYNELVRRFPVIKKDVKPKEFVKTK